MPSNRRRRNSESDTNASEEIVMSTETETDVIPELDETVSEGTDTDDSASDVTEEAESDSGSEESEEDSDELSDAEQVAKMDELFANFADNPLAISLFSVARDTRNLIVEQNKRATNVTLARKKGNDSSILEEMNRNTWDNEEIQTILTELAEFDDMIKSIQEKRAERLTKGLALAKTFMDIPSESDIEELKKTFDENKKKVDAGILSVTSTDKVLTTVPGFEGIQLLPLMPKLLTLHGGNTRKAIPGTLTTDMSGTPQVPLVRAYRIKTNVDGTQHHEDYAAKSRKDGSLSTSTNIVARNLRLSTSTNPSDRVDITPYELATEFLKWGNWTKGTEIPNGTHEWEFSKQIGSNADGTPIVKTWQLGFVLDRELPSAS